MKDGKIIGSDLDGTWTDHPELWTIVDIIVTGNSWESFNTVMDYIDGPKRVMFFNPIGKSQEALMNIVNHKAEIINKIGISGFYEDQLKQVNMLKILCPNCTIHHVEEDKTAI